MPNRLVPTAVGRSIVPLMVSRAEAITHFILDG